MVLIEILYLVAISYGDLVVTRYSDLVATRFDLLVVALYFDQAIAR